MSGVTNLDTMCPFAQAIVSTTGLGTWLEQVRTLIAELAADHATQKTSYDTTKDLISEMHDDHATSKTSHDAMETLIEELHDDHATYKTVVDELVATINELITQYKPNQVLVTGTTAGIAVDANAQDIETVNTIIVRHNGIEFAVAAVAAFDISASGACAGATIGTSKYGVGWVYTNTAGALDVEVDKDAQDYTSAIAAWAQYAVPTNTLPPGTDDVCIGAVLVQEGGSGTWTWGTDSISGETETFVDFCGLPGVETVLSSFALDAGAATFTYGTAKVRLGSRVRVAATGKANVTISGSNVATTKTGAWLFYILADDVELAVQLGAAYADLATAQAAVRDHDPNPYLPLVGVIYVENASGANFVPGTTNFDATGITATFTKVGVAANWLEFGRGQLGQPNSVMANAAPATLGSAKPASGPATLTTGKPAAGPTTLSAPTPASIA